MASVYRPTGRKTYRIEFVDQHGATRTVSSGMKDARAAQALALKLEEDAERLRAGREPRHLQITGQILGLIKGSTFTEAITAYLVELHRRGSLAGGHHHYVTKTLLERIARETRWDDLREVAPGPLLSFLGRLSAAGRAPRTQNKYVEAVRRLMRFSVKMHWLEKDPLEGVEPLKVGQVGRRRRRRAYLLPELDRLCAAAGEAHRRCYRVAAFSGFRRGELGRLQREDCTPIGDRPRWHVPAAKTKNGQPVDLPMSPECALELAPIWQSLPAGGALVDVPHPATFRRHRAKAGIPYQDERGRVADFHSLRCTFATLLARIYPLEVVSKLMRHSSIQLTANIYLDLGLDRTGEGEWTLQPLTASLPTAFPTIAESPRNQKSDQPAA